MQVDGLKRIVAKMDFYSGKIYNTLYSLGVSIVGRIVYPLSIIKNKNTYINAESYFPELERKPLSRILWEQLVWAFKYGDINKYYFMWGGDIKGKSLKDFVPWFKWVNARQCKNKMPKRPEYDTYNSVCLLRDKFYFEAILKKAGYTTPCNIMMINDGKLYLLNNNEHCIPHNLQDITNYDIDAFCKKNVGHGGGMSEDVFPLKIKDGIIFIRNQEVAFEEFSRIVSNSTCSWIIQDRIKNQAKFMSQFHPASINTIRIVTVKEEKNVDAICAFARFGINNRGSDNWSSGGILVGIDVNTGEFEEYGLFKPGVGTKSLSHPNTNVTFKGQIVPNWKEIVEYAKSLHEIFYDLHSIGWDVCLTEDGPLIIEGNDNWDTIDAQFYHPGKILFDKYFK